MNDPAQVVDAIWSQFADRSITRLDGELLRFNHDNAAPGVSPSANTLSELMAQPDGKARCTAWAEFFAATLNAHGIAAEDKRIAANFEVVPGPAQGSAGNYAIVTWNFHQIVRVGLHPGRIYDPSYGGTYTSAPPGAYANDAELIEAVNLAWEDANVVAIFGGGVWFADPKGTIELWYEQ